MDFPGSRAPENGCQVSDKSRIIHFIVEKISRNVLLYKFYVCVIIKARKRRRFQY